MERKKGPRKAEDQILDRLPPHSTEAEAAVLGCIMLDPSANVPISIIEMETSQAFYDLRHRTIYDAIVALYDEGSVIDMVTLTNRLRAGSQLEGVGGVAYVSSLPETTGGPTLIKTYTKIIVDCWVLRKLIAESTETVAKAFERADPVDTILDDAEHRILAVSQRSAGKTYQSVKVLMNSALEKIEKLSTAGAVTGLATGFYDLDKLTGGLQKGDLVLLAARPSVGKSSIVMNMVDYIAVNLKQPVGVMTLEMTNEQVMLRLVSARARVNLRGLSNLNEEDRQSILQASKTLRKAPIVIDDERNVTVLKARAKARRMVSEQGIKLLVIDYLQLLSAPEARRDSRASEVSTISTGLKNLAGELNIPIMALSQLNREMDKEKERAPRLSDLRESGSLEQDADMVAMLWKKGEESQGVMTVGAQLAKNRNGPTGHFELTFFKHYTLFQSASKEEVDPMI